MKNNIIQTFKILITAVILSFSISYVYAAWQGPPNNPDTCPSGYTGCNAPLNVGLNSQSKFGQLKVNTDLSLPYATGLFVSGNAVFDNKVGIGTTTPKSVLHVETTNNTPLLTLTSDASSEIIFDPQGIPDNKFQLGAWNGKFTIGSFFGSNDQSLDLVTVEGSTGKVGIGTTTPETVLHLQTTDNTPLLQLTSDVSSEIIFDPEGTPKYKFQLKAYGGNFTIGSFFNSGGNSSRGIVKVNGETGNFQIKVNGSKLIMKSPDNTCSACGPTNNDGWRCSPVAC
mgnify:CR=1 FL=1